MAAIDIRDFRGLALTRDARALETNEATEARHPQFDGSGALRTADRPWEMVGSALYEYTDGDPEPLAAKTIYFYDDGGAGMWLSWTKYVEVTRGPNPADIHHRLYLTGDGIPKMTHDAIAPSWRALGIPAPVAALTTTTADPVTAIAGSITSVTATSLKMIHECKNHEGRNSGVGETNVVATTTPVTLSTFPVGTRVKVATVVDADHVTVTGVGDISYSAPVDKLNYGLKWTNSSGDSLWRKRKKAYWNFLIPTGVTLAITDHGLEVGDIIQITATTSPLSWTFATLATTPNTDNTSRTATLSPSGGNIVFSGDCNFIIERDGVTIDPLVPSADYTPEDRSYVYTYVTDLGEESGPSPASDILAVTIGNAVAISGFTAPPSGLGISYWRIYRTNTGSTGSEFQFVAELPIATTTYNDTLASAELGEVLPSETWLEPDDNMRGIAAMPNGMMVGYFNRTLCFCEPNYPHAWPAEYQYPVESDIQGIAVFGNSVFVGTKGAPYVFTGAHPRQMAWRRIPINAPMLGTRSATNVGDRVVYCSTDGIFAVNEDTAYNLTETLYPPRLWRQRLLEVDFENADFEIHAFAFQRRVEFVTSIDAGEVGHLPTRDELIGLWFNGQRVDMYTGCDAFDNSWVDPATDDLYKAVEFTFAVTTHQEWVVKMRPDLGPNDSGLTFATAEGGGQAGYFGSGIEVNSAELQWSSKLFSFPTPINLSWLRVVLDHDPRGDTDWTGSEMTINLTVRLTNGESRTITRQVIYEAAPTYEDLLYRLPEGLLAESASLQVTLRDPVVVKRLVLGQTVDEVLSG